MDHGQYILVLWLIFYIIHSTYGTPAFVVTSTEPSNGQERGKRGASSQVPTAPEIYELQIHSTIRNRFAHVSITSKVLNMAEKAQEVAFSIIFPDTAFISGFIMEIDGKPYTARVKEKEEAQRDYDKAVSSGLGAAHVAVSARESNRFTVSVNVEAATRAAFYLTYEELLIRKDSRYELVINIHPGQPIMYLSVEVMIKESKKLINVKAPPLRSGNEISKENDELDPRAYIRIINDKEAVIRFSPNFERQKELAQLMKTDKDKGLSAQFVIQYDVERDPTGGEVLIRDGYFVHFFAPSELEPLPKHVVFVLDTSGSMWGNRLKQLQEAMHKILQDLHETDTFSLMQFSTNIKVWNLNDVSKIGWRYYQRNADISSFEFPNGYPANAKYIQIAKSSVSKFSASGGTNIFDALRVALGVIDRETKTNNNEREPLIMFLTDGEATSGITDPDEIINQITKINAASRKTPIFSLAFGTGADKKFLQKLSLNNYGFSKYIYEAADASLQLQDFYKQISSPLLSNVKFKYESSANDVTETNFPFYNKGTEQTVSGTYDKAKPLDPKITCSIGKVQKTYTPVIIHTKSNIERLWAYLTIKQLLESKELSDGNAGERKQKALDLSLKHNFITPVSSLVVVKPNGTYVVDPEEATECAKNNNPVHAKPSAQSTKKTNVNNQAALLTKHLPWLSNILDNNGFLTLPTGTYKVGLNEKISDLPTCPNTPLNTNGHCTLLKDCPHVYSLLTTTDVFVRHFCGLKNNYAGVCCPSADETKKIMKSILDMMSVPRTTR